jgi:hypothetical protein
MSIRRRASAAAPCRPVPPEPHAQLPRIVTLRAFDAPGKVRREGMQAGGLASQYEYFFVKNRIGDDIGFYGWQLAPNLGISQIYWLRQEFGRLALEKKLSAAPNE